jgi:hypothetical protein
MRSDFWCYRSTQQALTGSGANTAAFYDDGRVPTIGAVEEPFKGRYFDREIVVLCVRWVFEL